MTPSRTEAQDPTARGARPRLSVVMSNFNHARFLQESLAAILRHPDIPAEVIVVDDASTDESLTVLERICVSDHRVQLHRNTRNMGVVANAGRLLQMATGDYLYFAAADDFVLPGFFERSLSLLARYPRAGLCSTLTRVVDEQGLDRGVLPTPQVSREAIYIPAKRVREILTAIGAWFQGNTVIMRRDALDDAGGYRAELEAFTDSFAAQVVALRWGACFIPEALTAWRILPDQYSRRVFRDAARRSTMIARAVDLMEGPYNRDFPSGYARQWRGEMEISASRRAVAERRARRAANVASLLSRTGLRFLGGPVSAALAWIEWFVYMVALAPGVPPHVLRRYLYRRLPWARSR